VTFTALTGSGGFLGWHVRSSLYSRGIETRQLVLGDKFDVVAASDAISGASHLIHIAGVNRGSDDEVLDGNLRFATQIAAAIERAQRPPSLLTFANSIQAGNGTVYGEAKARAAELLAAATERAGTRLRDVLLPNLFGEHGRPFYNSVVSTFCHQLVNGEKPIVHVDRDLTLLHAQNASDLLTLEDDYASPRTGELHESVSGVLTRLAGMAEMYSHGDIPDLTAADDRDLFNTLRSYTTDGRSRIPLTRHADARGSFFEVVRSHGGAGQTSFSTTAPGISRGDHFHLRKVERFIVLSGSAVISMRRLFSDQVIEFEVNADQPTAIDMPTMWAHAIRNMGQDDLYTAFWSNELFDAARPDTVAERVSL
jgi:UDP-2-acetamido-2,6-beta-L-arabino-hexul-4-ose reductase